MVIEKLRSYTKHTCHLKHAIKPWPEMTDIINILLYP